MRQAQRLFFSSALLAIAFAQQPTTIRVPVRLVTVPTLVLSKQGRVIDGLTQSNFQLLDNRHPQDIKLEMGTLPLSVALAIQVNDDVRGYLPFITKIGSVIDTMLLAQTGEAAVLTYNGNVTVLKPFDKSDIAPALKKLSAGGQHARLIDAGLKAIALLQTHQGARSRVLLFIGQPSDRGSAASLSTLQQQAQTENIAIYALTLPEMGKSFVSNSFRLTGLGSQGSHGGYQASVELTRLLPALTHTAQKARAKDPFSLLTSATGGVQLGFRKQSQLEDALILIGQELRSLYLLTYSPESQAPGAHTIAVHVDISGAQVFARPGYSLPAN